MMLKLDEAKSSSAADVSTVRTELVENCRQNLGMVFDARKQNDGNTKR